MNESFKKRNNSPAQSGLGKIIHEKFLGAIRLVAGDAFIDRRSHSESEKRLLRTYDLYAPTQHISACLEFSKIFGEPKDVAYVGSGDDVSPLVAFKDAKVSFIDNSIETIAHLAKNHTSSPASFHAISVEKYNVRDRHDLLIDIFSGVSRNALDSLRDGGYLLHNSAVSRWAFEDPRLRLVGVITSDFGKILYDAESIVKFSSAESVIDEDRRSSGRMHSAEWYIFQKIKLNTMDMR